MTFRERLALRLLAWASWALPQGHHAVPLLHSVAVEILSRYEEQ